MTSLMPETIEPATGTLPLPKAKKARKNWTQAEVGAFVSAFVERGKAVVRGDYPERFSADEAAGKLRELGLLEKPSKPILMTSDREIVDDAIADMLYEAEPERTLQIRYAIKALTALLPKRVTK